MMNVSEPEFVSMLKETFRVSAMVYLSFCSDQLVLN